jgi:Tfp pilus assembly protein FimT
MDARTLAAAATRRAVAAFTLLEVLLSLAIIALLAGVLVGTSAHLLSEQPVTTEQTFWKVVQEARKSALKLEHEVRVRFDAQKKQFVLIDATVPSVLAPDGFSREEAPLKVFPLPPAGATDLSVDFLAAKSGNQILVGGVVIDTQTLPFVTFYPDGTCTPFRLQFTRNNSAYTLAVDPWTCAPVLPAVDPNVAQTP